MANSSIVGLLKVLLTADTAQFSAEMKRVSSSAQAWQKDLASVGRQATALGSSLTKTLTLPIVGLGVASLKAAIDFESSFAGVRKTVDATESEFAALAQEFRDLSKQIPINVNDLNRLGEAAGALGIPKAAIADFSRVMALLGVTTNVTADQAAESIAKIQNIFGAAGKDTERFASTLVQLGNVGASTEQEILALATRIASAGNTIGLSQGQVLGFSAAIANVGMEAEAGGSAISRVFVDIASAVSKGGVAVAGFAEIAGMSAAQFTKAFKEDAAGATLAFVQGLGRIKDGGGDLIGVLNALGFTELRQADLLRRLAGDSDGLKKSLDTQNSAWRENTALSEEARKRFETTASQLKLLWNQIQDVAITIGNALLPTIQSLVALTGRLLPLVDSLAKGFAALPSPLQLGVFALGAMVAVTGPLIFLFGQLMLSASALAGAFAANGIATRALAVAQGTLAGTSSALTIAMGLLWKATALGAVAFTGWKIGPWIGQVTGATEAVEVLAGRLSGLTLAEVEAGIAARKQAAAHQSQQSAISDSGMAASEAATITAALTKAQKDGESAARGAAGATADLATRLAKQAEAAEKAKAAAKLLADANEEIASAGEGWLGTLAAIDAELVITVKRLMDAGVSQQALALKYKLTDTQVRAIAKSLAEEHTAQDKAADAAERHAKALDELDSVGDSWKSTVAAMDGKMVAAIKSNLEAGASQAALAEAYSLTDAQVRAINKSLIEQKRVQDITNESLKETDELWREHYDLIAGRSRSTIEQQIADVNRWAAREIAKLKESDENWKEHYDAIQQVAKDKTDAITNQTRDNLNRQARDADNHFREMVAMYGRYSDQAQDALDELVEANRLAGKKTVSLWEAAWNATTRVVTDAVGALRDLFTVANLKKLFVDPMETILDILGGIFEKFLNRLLEAGLNKFLDWLLPFIGIGGGGIKPVTPGVTPLGPGRGLGVPGLGSGGIVSQPTLAMLGESGPEAVVPLRAGGGGFGSQTIILEVDGMVMARASVPYIPGELRRLRLA